MSIDLKKMVDEWKNTHCTSPLPLRELLTIIAAEIEAMREEIGGLKAELRYCQRIKPNAIAERGE